MPAVNIVKLPTSSPADVTPLKSLKEKGYSVEDILGVVGKTEGNGCVNDFSRTLSTHIWDPLIPSRSISIFSGGTEGVLSPHVTFIVSSPRPTGLIASVSRTREFLPREIGTAEHVKSVASTVEAMLKDEGLSADDVQLVLIKCPLLTSEKITKIQKEGERPITTDTYESMAKSRYASAVGISVALKEIGAASIDATLSTTDHWTAKASCSSGAELEDCHILVIANAPTNSSSTTNLPSSAPYQDSTPSATEDNHSTSTVQPPFKISHHHQHLHAFSTVMHSAIDYPSLSSLLTLALTPPPPFKSATLLQVFAKAEADPSGLIHGHNKSPLNESRQSPTSASFRHTMTTDSDIHSTRHARAAVGGLIAGVTGDCHVYVSGGAEGQGPVGGGGVCVVVGYD